MEIEHKRVLGLELPTDPRWVEMAEMSIEDILTDHAYCEQKAAATCISLIQKYPEHTKLVDELAPIVTEEWGHFRMVLKELKKRNLSLGKQRKDDYVNGLQQFIRKGVSPLELLLDRLIVCAMIEARSCERFRLLSLQISDDNLKNFYHQFMVSEAGHFKLFLELAAYYSNDETSRNRWIACLEFESAILKNLHPRGDRMH
jgi:tRNA-(ms[2]io[6]A)-hydroxylase